MIVRGDSCYYLTSRTVSGGGPDQTWIRPRTRRETSARASARAYIRLGRAVLVHRPAQRLQRAAHVVTVRDAGAKAEARHGGRGVEDVGQLASLGR